MAKLYKLSLVLLPCWKEIGVSGKERYFFLVGGYEAASFMMELQYCLSSVCILVLLKKNPTGTSNVELG